MGCLNSNEGFAHWFGNIHLSGPCNRACYFCIGQHMMALDSLNNLDTSPLEHIELFVDECIAKGITEINVTGSNTDPLLYKHMAVLKAYLKSRIPDLVFGLRTNGVLALERKEIFHLFDKASLSICSMNPDIYVKTMGRGSPPNVREILKMAGDRPVKVNIISGPDIAGVDFWHTLNRLAAVGIKKVNLREPYGQPVVGDLMLKKGLKKLKDVYGMPCYKYYDMQVTYWDVHFVEVESVNLYANGRVSVTYPISKGHDPETGKVLDQSNFLEAERHTEQWNYKNA